MQYDPFHTPTIYNGIIEGMYNKTLCCQFFMDVIL